MGGEGEGKGRGRGGEWEGRGRGGEGKGRRVGGEERGRGGEWEGRRGEGEGHEWRIHSLCVRVHVVALGGLQWTDRTPYCDTSERRARRCDCKLLYTVCVCIYAHCIRINIIVRVYMYVQMDILLLDVRIFTVKLLCTGWQWTHSPPCGLSEWTLQGQPQTTVGW